MEAVRIIATFRHLPHPFASFFHPCFDLHPPLNLKPKKILRLDFFCNFYGDHKREES
jgi:hypothetical protein